MIYPFAFVPKIDSPESTIQVVDSRCWLPVLALVVGLRSEARFVPVEFLAEQMARGSPERIIGSPRRRSSLVHGDR